MENSKRNIVIIIAVVLVLIGAITIFMKLRSNGGSTYQYSINTGSGTTEASLSGTIQSDADVFAYVSELSGNVKKTGTKGIYFLKESGETLSAGDMLKTGGDGTATVTFSDNSVIRLNNNSEISFRKLAKDDTILDLKN